MVEAAEKLYTVEPLNDVFGGIIRDLDMSDPFSLSEAIKEQIKADLHLYRFLVIRAPPGVEIRLSAEEHLEVASWIGKVGSDFPGHER